MLDRLRSILGQGPAPADAEGGAEKQFGRCVLHIGTEKTGTSTIQRFLSLNRGAFLQDGVVYPAATGRNGGSQWGFVACANDRTWETDVGAALGIATAEAQEGYRAALRRELQREFAAAARADTLLISSEHFHSRLGSPEAIARLRDYLAPWVAEFVVVLYLRRQDRVAVSHYSTKIKSGNAAPVLFPGAPKGVQPYYFDYERIYQNWCAVFGAAALRVRLFEPATFAGGDLLSDFCAAAELQAAGKQRPPPQNEALDSAAAAFLLEVNRQLPNLVDGKRNAERDALARLVASLCRGRIYPASRAAAQDFYQRFAASNQRLKELIFPDRAGPLFDEDFSDYPEGVDQLVPRYEDAVALAIRIWRASN